MRCDAGESKGSLELLSLFIDADKFQGELNQSITKAGFVAHIDTVTSLKMLRNLVEATNFNDSRKPTKSKSHREKALDSLELGVRSSGSKKIDAAITVLRLLHCHQLRTLQTKVNELMCALQRIIANPKCDLNLGRIGR